MSRLLSTPDPEQLRRATRNRYLFDFEQQFFNTINECVQQLNTSDKHSVIKSNKSSKNSNKEKPDPFLYEFPKDLIPKKSKVKNSQSQKQLPRPASNRLYEMSLIPEKERKKKRTQKSKIQPSKILYMPKSSNKASLSSTQSPINTNVKNDNINNSRVQKSSNNSQKKKEQNQDIKKEKQTKQSFSNIFDSDSSENSETKR